MSLSASRNDRPFRLEPLTPPGSDAPDGPVWQAVVARGPIEDAIRGLDANDIDVWLKHPDERFALALAAHVDAAVDSTYRRLGFSEAGWLLSWLEVQLYRRGAEQARDRGEVWHPLFDALDANHNWPYVGQFDEDVEREEISARAWARKLIPWIEDQDDPRTLEALLTFQSDRILELVARHAPAPDADLVEAVLERDPELIDRWAANPSLSADLARSLVDRAARELTRKQEDSSVPSSANLEHRAARTFLALREAGQEIPGETLDRLIDALPGDGQGHRLVTALQGAGNAVTREQYLRLYEQLRGSSSTWILERLATASSPTARPMQRRLIAEASGQHLFKVRKAMAGSPAHRTDPDIQEHLLDTTSKEVLSRLLEAFAGEDDELFARSFRALCSAHLDTALRATIGSWTRHGRGADWSEHLTDELLGELRGRIADLGDKRTLLTAVERLDGARHDARVRQALLALDSGSPEHLLALVGDARGAEMREIFRRLVDGWPYQALEVLEQDPPPSGLDDLRGEDIVPLLRVENSTFRQRALLATSRLPFETPHPRDRPPVQNPR